jgi:hypothetical protein
VDAFLQQLGYTEIATYTDEFSDDPVCRRNILDVLHRLVRRTHAEAVDEVFLHFSGHGTNRIDLAEDEADGRDECIVPVDVDTYGTISDDLLTNYLERIHPRTRVVCLFDCCHSGTILDLPFVYGSPTPPFTLDWAGPEIICFSGCKDTESSADTTMFGNKATGAMTTCVLNVAYNRLMTGQHLYLLSMLEEIRNMLTFHHFAQTPQLSSTRPLGTGTKWFEIKGT